MQTSKMMRGGCAALASIGLVGAGAVSADAVAADAQGVPIEESVSDFNQVIVEKNGTLTPSALSTAKAKRCKGHYKRGNKPCRVGSVPGGTFKTLKGCRKHGRFLMANVHRKTNSGRIGYYTYGCTKAVRGGYMLDMAGFVYVFDTNATHGR